LLKELTYLPIAIVQAASYINVNKITLQEYLSLLAEKKKEVVEPISKKCESVVATTWLISFEQISRYDTLAADRLLFMACVNRNDVPLALLPDTLPHGKGISAVETLVAYSFVTKRTAESALNLHRLVYVSTRNWLERKGLLGQWTQVAIKRLLEVFPDDNHGSRSKWRRLLPHAKCVLSYSLPEQENEARADLVWKCAMALYSDGRYNEAEEYFQESIKSRSRLLGNEHPSTLTSMANLALTVLNQGRLKEAKELEVQVIETSKRALREEHPSTLASMGNLASTFLNQGRWKEAEELLVQVVETSKRVLGKEHPSTLASMGNLALTFSDQGRWKEAEELDVQVTEIRMRVFGEEHPATLASRGNLELTFLNQGR
jgi:tetratricopeptide (TPR) repeat protein